MTHTFHFSCGDSTIGTIGFCCRITAESPQEALRILQAALPTELEVATDDDRIEYLNVYFSAENLRVGDIDEEDDGAFHLADWEGEDGPSAPL